jgi:phosphoglycolate phosphatase-like HAD superfamily hydrolase
MIIFDIDGTLVDVSGQGLRDWLTGKRTDYDEYHRIVRDAPAIPWVVRLAQDFWNQGHAITLLTVRGEEYWSSTVEWLKENGVPYDRLIMRKKGDHRSDLEVKTELLWNNTIVSHVQLAVEDNPLLVEKLWRPHNIPTVVVPGWED